MTNANQSEEKRIYELDEISSLSPGLYVPVDQAALEMAKKFDLGTSLAGKADATELNEVREEVESIGKPLKLIGSATVAELNGTIEDLQPGWTYTLIDGGTLTAGDVSVDVGDEVAWSESAVWVKIGGDSGKIAVFYVDYVMGRKVYPDPDEILAAIGAGKFVVVDEPNQGVWNHVEWLLENAGRGAQDYIKFTNGSNTLIATRDNTAEEPSWEWDTGFVNGIIDGGSKTESNLVDGALVIGGGNSLTKLTLTTVQTLTVKANGDIPNFALEIDNTGNSNDVTVTVKDFAGTTTLKASAAGGDTVGAGKYMQLTCVGSCWTLSEFTVPAP